jgi:hypothetical protein
MPEAIARFGSDKSGPAVALLLACARTQVTPDIADRIRILVLEDVDWIALIRLAIRHDVMPLLYRNLQQVCPDSIPECILAPLRARYEAQATHASRNVEALLQILPLLEDHGIRAVPYKGPALAQRLYGDVSLRPFGDLDISVAECDVIKAQDLIRSIGYEFAWFKETDKLTEYVRTDPGCELQLKRSDGIMVELHWRFANRTAQIQQDPKPFLQKLEMIALAGTQVRSLPLETYFMVLSMHATKHKWGQLKLICDIAEILGRTDVDWKYVAREANDLGLRRMLAVGSLLAQDSLGAEIPPEVAHGLKIDRAARTMATQVRRGLFAEPDKEWHDAAGFSFQFKMRERLRDKWLHLSERLQPSERDERFLPLPKSLSSLHYLIRPVRWAWEKTDARNSARSVRGISNNL